MVLCLLACGARGADIVMGDVTSVLGPDFFFDDAATGGGDNNATTFTRDISGYWTPGATVTLKGLGWASPSTGAPGGTAATTATVTFTDLGPDNAFGTTDDVVVGSVTDDLVFTGTAGEFVWNFDADPTFSATGSSLRISIVGNGNIRRKTVTGTTTQAGVKLSLAGTAVGGTPPPVVNTATSSGFWDSVSWNNGSGATTGGVGGGDTVVIGQYRRITYRGTPSNETLATLHLGENSGNTGQGTLVVNAGTLHVTGNLVAGRNDSPNDSFVSVTGGTLQIGGDAIFGRSAQACDGSLTVAGGTFRVDGDLAMGSFAHGGSMLRFHNPGSSPPVEIGGTLVLGRCSLDLTFDSAYTHAPGSVITLASFAGRDGQFLNFRQGEEFNSGPNRFRITYTATAVSLTALANWTPPANRPNIILIFADDGGYADLSLNGNAKFPTPELDSLAADGVRFTDHYVTAGVCHPSRCGLLTGKYQQHFGTDNNLSGASVNGMAVSQRTVPRRLQGLGYRTYGIGKWHLGDTVEFHPNCRGFDRWYGMWGGSRSFYDAGSSESQVFQDQMTPDFASENTAYLTDRIGDKAVAFINEHLASPQAAEPFFMYVSFTAIHAPMDIQGNDPRFARLQSEFGLTAADYQNSSPVFGGSNQATVDQNRYELAAMTLAMDEQIGKIRDKLANAGISNNTLVVYTNDNGGAGWTASSGGNYSYNTPLRGYKGASMTDGSIRVPAAAAWPGTIPAGQTVTEPVIALDWGATFVNATGNAPPAARNGLDGLDLMPLLRDATPLPADRVLCWRAGGNVSGGSAARMGDWKLLIADPGGTPKLYNLRNDIGENNDRAAAQPAILNHLLSRFRAWEARTLPPLYGTADTLIDSGLEYWPISGGLRLSSPSATPLWISSTRRDALSTAADFDLAFSIRASEPAPYPSGAALWSGLGDSTNRSHFIRAGVDFAAGRLVLTEGKTGNTASAPLATLPTSPARAILRHRAATGTLSLELGGQSVTLALNGTYGSLGIHAMGSAAIEGEVSTLRTIGTGDPGTGSVTSSNFGSSPLRLRLTCASEPPSAPVLERSPFLHSFAPDPDALVESLGGGIYQYSTPSSSLPREFFRFSHP
jgi:arylsulfatase A-like enzyme